MEKNLLIEKLGELIERVIEFNFHVSEETTLLGEAKTFVPPVLSMLEESNQALRIVQEIYDREDLLGNAAEGAGEDDLAEIGALISEEMAARGISDLAFLARGELRECLKGLEVALEQKNLLRMASGCDSGLRRMRKALISVESAIHEYEGREAPMRVWCDLELSLEIRRCYSELRECLMGADPPEPEHLEQRLGQASKAFVDLRSLSVYPLLRIDDRVYMRKLHRRIGDWQSEGKDPQDGLWLWQDLVGFSELLAMINHRQELREHDRKLVRRIHHQLHNQRGSQVGFPPALMKDFEMLRGLDPGLDELIRDPASHSPKDWLLTLARLSATLDPNSPARQSFALL